MVGFWRLWQEDEGDDDEWEEDCEEEEWNEAEDEEWQDWKQETSPFDRRGKGRFAETV